MVERPLITYFRTKLSVGYKNLVGKFENNAFLNNFSTDLSTLTLSLPHILRTIGFFNFPPIFYLSNLDLAKVWLALVYSKQSYA